MCFRKWCRISHFFSQGSDLLADFFVGRRRFHFAVLLSRDKREG